MTFWTKMFLRRNGHLSPTFFIRFLIVIPVLEKVSFCFSFFVSMFTLLSRSFDEEQYEVSHDDHNYLNGFGQNVNYVLKNLVLKRPKTLLQFSGSIEFRDYARIKINQRIWTKVSILFMRNFVSTNWYKYLQRQRWLSNMKVTHYYSVRHTKTIDDFPPGTNDN